MVTTTPWSEGCNDGVQLKCSRIFVGKSATQVDYIVSNLSNGIFFFISKDKNECFFSNLE